MHNIQQHADDILAQIKKLSSPRFKTQMAVRFGINTVFAVGTPVTQLRLLAKHLSRPDQPLADALWQTGVHEARILAAMVADPARMTRTQLNTWVKDLNSWDICDACCTYLFSKVKKATVIKKTLFSFLIL
jgi:3-methyladenine DNA glycosylase AlkD